MKRFTLLTGLAVLLSGWAALASAYGYPVKNAYEATVVGTPPEDIYSVEHPRKVKQRLLSIKFDAGWSKVPMARSIGLSDLKCLFAWQDGPAPLIFVIAGTGASFASPKVMFLKDTFYQAGYHVITISSPTKPPFMANASSTFMPGLTNYDARDLYRVMTTALDMVKDEITITKTYLTGYSLGGIESAFVGQLDSQRKEINFDKVLIINPPVNLYTSLSNLDNLVREFRKKHPQLTSKALFNSLFTRVAAYYKDTRHVSFGPDTLYAIQNSKQKFPIDEIELLIGFSFLFSSADIAFTSDALNHSGWIIPADQQLDLYSSDMIDFYQRSLHWDFLSYFDKMVVPWWQQRHPDDDKDDIIRQVSLYAIEDYLRNTDSVSVMTNSDDIILGDGDIEYLRDVFGDRATIYPLGGHVGNLEYKENVVHMLEYFRD